MRADGSNPWRCHARGGGKKIEPWRAVCWRGAIGSRSIDPPVGQRQVHGKDNRQVAPLPIRYPDDKRFGIGIGQASLGVLVCAQSRQVLKGIKQMNETILTSQTASEEIVDAIQESNLQTREMAGKSDDVKTNAETLSNLAAGLQEKVGRFKILTVHP